MLVLIAAAGISLLAWCVLYLHPACPWDFQPVGDTGGLPSLPPGHERWPAVGVVIPARDEAAVLPRTLPALLNQEYQGATRVVLVDDGSVDGTADMARALAHACGLEQRLQVLAGTDLPEGWIGKTWALEQGARAVLAGEPHVQPSLLLLTDADILHGPHSLRRLVAEALAGELELNSRMANLFCQSSWERLLIPAFVFFFNLLYPMRYVNSLDHAVAAAAGGCVLLSHKAFAAIGGFQSIRNELIDDVNLAKRVKGKRFSIRLSLSCTDVVSLRHYETLSQIWSMVRRTAFTELHYSWVRLAGTVAGMVVIFVVPVLAAVTGLFQVAVALNRSGEVPGMAAWLSASAGLVSLGIMSAVYRPATCFYGLPRLYTWSLPLAALLYLGMTLDSALRHAAGMRSAWRGRTYAVR